MGDLRFDAIVFDFDGVILESAAIKTEAFSAIFADESEEDREAIVAHHLNNMGISRFEKFEWAYRERFRRPLSEERRKELGQQFSAYVDERVRSCPFVPGAQEALRALHGRLPLYVASGTPHADLVAIIADRGLTDFFNEVWGSPRKKPDSLREVLEKNAIADPKRLLMIGDGESDFKAAQKVGASFYARETAEFPGDWRSLGVEPHEDLKELPSNVGSFG